MLSKSRFSDKIIYIFLLFCMALLSVHFRTGAGSDNIDFNFVAMAFRVILWFSVLLIATMIFRPKLLLVKPSLNHANMTYVIYSWPMFLFLTLISTVLSALIFGVTVSALDAVIFIQVIGCFFIMMLVYNLLKIEPTRVKGVMIVLMLLPSIQILGVIFISEELATVLGINRDYDFVWYFGYGNRFVGLLGNANAVAVQACISLAIISCFLLSKGHKLSAYWLLLKLFLILYACAVLAIIILTGVRAALLSILVMAFVIFINARARQKLIFIFSMFMFSIFGTIYGFDAGLFDVLLERLNQSDGRMFIWQFYVEKLAYNPIGYGLTFENVIDTKAIELGRLDDVRLTPHNAFLEIGVYSGLLGIILSIFLVIVFSLIMRPIYQVGFNGLNKWYLAACLAWAGLIVNHFFGGIFFGNWLFAILTGVILATQTFPIYRRD